MVNKIILVKIQINSKDVRNVLDIFIPYTNYINTCQELRFCQQNWNILCDVSLSRRSPSKTRMIKYEESCDCGVVGQKLRIDSLENNTVMEEKCVQYNV